MIHITHIYTQVQAVLFLNPEARGPFKDREGGQWWKHLLTPLTNAPQLALLGAQVLCDQSSVSLGM
jgi:hypothetical protein